MMTVSCPACGGEKTKHVFDDFGYDKKSYSVVECVPCGFRYLNPQPTDRELDEIYSKYYGVDGDEQETETHLDFRRPVFEKLCMLLDQNQGLKTSNGKQKIVERRLLDVGCGNGDFLALARDRGWTVSGVEVSKRAADYAKTKRGLDVRAGSLKHFPFAERTFDAVTILDVLEHVRAPRETLKSVHDIMKSGGRLVIRVPNTPFQFFKGHLQRLWHGRHFTTLAAPLHLNHFDNYSLRKMVEDSGFTVEHVLPGEADGAGRPLQIKRAWVSLSKLLVPAGLQMGNILELAARKP